MPWSQNDLWFDTLLFRIIGLISNLKMMFSLENPNYRYLNIICWTKLLPQMCKLFIFIYKIQECCKRPYIFIVGIIKIKLKTLRWNSRDLGLVTTNTSCFVFSPYKNNIFYFYPWYFIAVLTKFVYIKTRPIRYSLYFEEIKSNKLVKRKR